MTRKTLILALITAGLVVAATSAAFSLYPSTWFAKDTPAASSPAIPATSAATPAPVPALPAGATPNYRAIVQQAGPAAVGVTVAGLHKAGPDEFPLDLNDPFFQFFRGLPGFRLRLPSQEQGGSMPFRSQGAGVIISSDGLILRDGDRIFVPVELA